jgi:hypothetical protein
MKKSDLLERLKDVDDDCEIGAFWDDCEWEIDGVVPPTDSSSPFDILIDCR